MKISTNLPGPLVARLRRKWRINFFVETGTKRGDTTELAAVMFDQVWSCDIDKDLIDKATMRLAPYHPRVRLSVESSPDFLRRIKPQVCQPAMYWLDAHWCGGKKPIRECPLLDELKAIGSLNGHSIILIDDVELMENPPPPPHDPKQWPTMEQIRATLSAWGEPYTFELYQGENSRVLAVTPEEQLQ